MEPSGLIYKENYITDRHEHSLLMQISEIEWAEDRTQVYEHSLPQWADSLAMALRQDRLLPVEPNQVVVTEIDNGKSTPHHFDNRTKYDNTIVMLNLNFPSAVTFTNKYDPGSKVGDTIVRVLEPRSLLVLSGPARYWWTHSVPPQFAGRYISITFRTILEELFQINDQLIFDARALGGIVSSVL